MQHIGYFSYELQNFLLVLRRVDCVTWIMDERYYSKFMVVNSRLYNMMLLIVTFLAEIWMVIFFN